MEDLSADLMIDILSRLPVKTIIHCKLVCKKWRDLVLDSFFINLHLSRSPTALIIHRKIPSYRNVSKDPGILKLVEIEDKVDHHHLHHDPLMTLDLKLASILQNSQIHNKGSVNGLICLWQFCSKHDHNIYICNPITREYMILPRPRYYKQGYVMIFYGFGVSSVTGEYKVVRIFQGDILSRPSVLEAEVYTLGTCQWRSLGRVPYWLHGFYGTFLNNHCHWIVYDKDEKICSFDLDKETFQLFPSPPSEGEGIRGSLAVVKGCLSKLEAYGSHLTIWVMREYGIKKSWHKKVVIDQGVNFDPTLLIKQPPYLIEGLKDGSILMFSFNEKLMAYHPESNTTEETEILDPCFSVMTYRPSFIKLQNFESERVHTF